MKILLPVFLSFITISAFAQDKPKWDVSNPPGPYKEVTITTHEGTWMNLDVSPDGNTLVFDMLGDIYSLPVAGGTAALLRGGHAFEVQPRFSPDGKKICFTSDAGGGDNVWVMDADGKNAKQITQEDFRLLNNPVWTPDGQYIIARKHFTSSRSLGAGEMWMYHITGGSGIQLTKRKNDQQDVNEPALSPDGRYLYFSEDMYPGGYFQYNKDPNSQIYIIRRYDRETGELRDLISGPGGACRPQASPDGKQLAFVRRVRTQTVLYVHNLQTGQQIPVFDKLSKDQQEAWAIFGVYTGYNWLPDNIHIVIWAQGKLWKINTQTQQAAEIPFTATATHRIHDAVKFRQEVSPSTFEAKMIRHAITSPDGKTLVFSAVGYLWKKELPNGTPVRLSTQADAFEFEPVFSPDNKKLLYVTWNDTTTGAIWEYEFKKGKTKKITTEKGIFREPAYSSDGKKIVYRKEGGNDHQGFTYCENTGIYIADTDGKNVQLVSEDGSNPVFTADGKNIYYQQGKKYFEVDLSGNNKKELFTSEYGKDYTPSPDGKWIAFTDLHKAYIIPVPKSGKTFDLNRNTKAVPVSQVARDAGFNLHWSGDSKKLHYTLGEEYFTVEIKNRFLFVEGAADSIVPVDTVGIKIGLQLKTDKPAGTKLLTNARIITVDNNNNVIENGYILIKDNIITDIGLMTDVWKTSPKADDTIDCSGKTIMPGLVDVHAHLGTFRQGLHPQKHWPYYASLAYGITTTHDPSSNSEMVFTQSEMVKYGSMIGPRVYSTGTILYGADGDFKAVVNSLEDAKSAIRRTKALGAFSVKSYNQPRREQRQQVIEAARQLSIMVVPEGGSFFYHNMSMILDGHTGIEHNIPVAPAYNDVIQLWSASQTGYTPTLIVNYGGVNGEYYWYQHTNVWEKERLLNFTPRGIIDERSRHRTMIPEEEYENGHILVSKSCKQLSDSGVKVNLGSHGQIQGIGAHWELWMLAQGGMSAMEAIRSATMNGAQYIGMGDQIGSLEPGKLADLLIMDKNPLDTITNTESLRYTMINGRLYDCNTLNEVNSPKKRAPFWWENNGYNATFHWHEETNSFMPTQCGCGGHHGE
ncbi:MAG: amidohydrolase family protein [Bacteroidetes bacterium]|nr:MAG: amidohydrolase family protein [Bacteroidota bacterium]